MLNRSILIHLFGFHAAFLHGDPGMLDRWLFVCRHLPKTRDKERLFDVGCGTGAFTIGAAKRGYEAVGLSWDERNQTVAQQRAEICLASNASFPIGDARKLNAISGHLDAYEYVLSLENIEHIIDDRKLMHDLVACLKPGGWLILSAPNKDYRAITSDDDGPFEKEERGWHVRRGYTKAMLEELAASAGLAVEQIGGCTGFFSQKLTYIMRKWGMFGWAITIPLRILPLLFDRAIRKLFRYPDFSITMVAYKHRT